MTTTQTPAAAHPPGFTAEIATLAGESLRGFIASRVLPTDLREAVEYAALGGGKRLRPILAILSAEAVGGSRTDALPAALAVELVHAFSLVHDDLPALDNDDLRRGRPTLHVARGEALALLTGDLMLGLAFEALAEGVDDPALVGLLTRDLTAGVNGMIVGQVYDTLGGFPANLDDRAKLETIHRRKTGDLIVASCRMGARCALAATPTPGAGRALDLITAYADAVGLMFQIVDDLLDVEQTAEHLGKGAGKDQVSGKLTYPGVLGVEESRAQIDRLRRIALDAASALGPPARPIADLCAFLAVRTK